MWCASQEEEDKEFTDYEFENDACQQLADELKQARKKYFGLLIACVLFQLGLSAFILIDAEANG